MLPIAVAATLAGMATPSFAFQEQSVGGAPASAAPSSPGAQSPSLNLNLPNGAATGSSGVEVRIPGVGSLGALPKLDFGLELLYGANEPSVGRTDDRSQPSDMQIRATIKHRF